jgi:hypothetical protein
MSGYDNKDAHCRVQQQELKWLLSCMRTPEALSVSFRSGAVGSQDFFGIGKLLASISNAEDCMRLMEAFSATFCKRKPSAKAPKTIGLLLKEGEKLSASQILCGASAVHRAWYGPPQRDQRFHGKIVTERVKQLLEEEGHVCVSNSVFGSALELKEPSMVLVVDVCSDLEESDESSTQSEDDLPPSSWVAAAVALALPLLEGALPKDNRGICVLPHHHAMCKVEADKLGKQQRIRGGRHVWETGKVCDRCMDRIVDRVYYHCTKGCDVDFCVRCQDDFDAVLSNFFHNGAAHKHEAEYITERMMWTIHAIDEVANHILHRSARERMNLAQVFAVEWPAELFQRLVRVVVDVCNAKLLYNCENGALATFVTRTRSKDASSKYIVEALPLYDESNWQFWHSIGLLQFLYECSGLLKQERMLDGPDARGHKIAVENFILEGINQCNPCIEWDMWESAGSTQVFDVLRVPVFSCTGNFKSLVAHNNLLPISFRQGCLLTDMQKQLRRVWTSEHKPLVLDVDREPSIIIDQICQVFAEESADYPEGNKEADQLLRPLRVSFLGESYGSGVAARGPGVTREFFHVALRAFLTTFFEPTGRRTFWFGSAGEPSHFFACGVLLGQILLHGELIPRVFPSPLYELLLQDLGSPKALKAPKKGGLTLQHLAEVSQEEADALNKVLEYEGDNIFEAFGDLGWERVPALRDAKAVRLAQNTKADFIDAYVQWSFGEKVSDRYRPLSSGFRAVLGSSIMLRKLVDASQFESILCGTEAPVDVRSISRRAVMENWDADDASYCEAFWSVLESFPEATKLKFVMFVTGSDRMPLLGWEDLRVKVQKNGTDDDRLPSAYTCFSLVLLPKYSCVEALRKNLEAAVTSSQGFGLK